MFSGKIEVCSSLKFDSINGYDKIIKIINEFQKIVKEPISHFTTEIHKVVIQVKYSSNCRLRFERYATIQLIFEFEKNDINKFNELYLALEQIVNLEFDKE